MAFSDIVSVPISYLVLALLAGGARFLLIREPPTFKMLIATIVWGLLVVIASYDWLLDLATSEDKELNKGLVTLLVAIGAFGGKDILEILLKLLEQIKVDPLALLRDLLNRYKPGSGSGDDPK